MSNISALIISAALSYNVPPALLLSTCTIETSGPSNVHAFVDGSSASYGPCQVKLGTARLFNPKVHASDLFKPQESVKYAAQYLAEMLRRFRGDTRCALSGYNAGYSGINSRIARLGAKRACNTRYARKIVSHMEVVYGQEVLALGD
jgi:hypothetical protein